MSKVLRKAEKIEYPEIAIPDKLSQLLREVVEDMRQVGKHHHVKFDMSDWCRVNNTRCSVCAAGAWMYSKMEFTKDVEFAEKFIKMLIDDYHDIYQVMNAIDNLRVGHPYEFFLELNNGCYDFDDMIYIDEVSKELDGCFPATYNSDNVQSVMAAFNKCAKVLENHGL